MLTRLISAGVSFCLSTRSAHLAIPTELYYILLRHLQTRMPHLQLHSHITLAPSPSSRPLLARASFFDHVVIRGQRFAASTRTTNTSESLVAVSTSALGQTWVGELQYIFSIDQDVIGCHRFGKVKWYIPFAVEENTVWNQL